MLRLAHRLRLILFLLLIAAPALAQRDRDTYTGAGQTIEITGEVRSAETGTYAQGIQVRLERFSGGVLDQMPTDSRGRFRFINLQRGYYKVIISSPGYRPLQQDADLQVVFRAYLVFDLVADKAKGAGGVGELTDVIDARVPAEARAEFIRGREALSKKSAPDAIPHFQKAVELYPGFFAAHLLLGTAFVDLRQWEKAETEFLSALAIKSDNAMAMLALGEVYWREKRFQEAEKNLLAGLKLDEKSWHGHFTLARLYWERNEVMKAAPEIGRTLQLKPDFAEAHLIAGNILLRLNQPERARVEYEEYLRLAPKGEYAADVRVLIQKLKAADSKR